MEQARQHRLTRNQHVLFRLGEIIAYVECAGALCRRAAAGLDGSLQEKADRRFDGPALASLARVFAREAAAKVALDGTRWVLGAAEPGMVDAAGFEAAIGTKAIQQAQTGLIRDMDRAADAIYGRA
jgi:alkylation response protein AidB-like acyl-CoA dehydrogenase